MARMTWDQIKKMVDENLGNRGFAGDVEVEYIDLRNPDRSHEITTPYVTYEDFDHSISVIQ